MNNNVHIQLSIPEHYLQALIKIDEGKEISLQQRNLVAVADYINRHKMKNKIKEKYL